jgi:hypothetical protein
LAEEPVPEQLCDVDGHVYRLTAGAKDHVVGTTIEHRYARGDIVQEWLGLTNDYSFRTFRHGADVEASCL